MPEPSDTERPLAARHRRLAARAVDAVTVFFLLFALVVVRVFFFMDALSDRIDPEPWGRAFVATVTFVVMFAVYEIVFVSVRGQTPGKDLLKVRVEHVHTNRPPGRWRTTLRWALPGLLCLLPPVWLAALAVTALGVTAVLPGRRAIHDVMAGTRVVAYDADLEEGETEKVDREELSRTYGPRTLLDLLRERLEPSTDQDRPGHPRRRRA